VGETASRRELRSEGDATTYALVFVAVSTCLRISGDTLLACWQTCGLYRQAAVGAAGWGQRASPQLGGARGERAWSNLDTRAVLGCGRENEQIAPLTV
jgi:hypothetical protein